MAPFQDFSLNFNAAQFDPKQSEGGICLPLADYAMEITNIAQVAVTDNPNKGFIEVSLTVVAGQYKGQVQKDRLNVYGQAETPTRIGYQRLSAYAHIAGKQTLPNAGALLGTKLIATCGPQAEPNDKYSEVKMVKDVAGNPPVFGQPGAPQPPAGQPWGESVAAATAAQPAFTAAQPTQAAQPAAGGWNNPANAAPAAAAPAQTAFPVQNVPETPAAGGWGSGAAATTGAAPSWAK